MKATPGAPSAAGTTLDRAKRHLYDAECALHLARQTRVDKWIVAASDHLHLAVLELDAAERSVSEMTQSAS